MSNNNINDIKECYSVSYGKLTACEECPYKDYCKESSQLEKETVINTQKDQMNIEIGNIFDQEKQTSTTGEVLAALLKVSHYNPIMLYVIILRMGFLTYREISDLLGVSYVTIFKMIEALPKQLSESLSNKRLTFIELEEACKPLKEKATTEEKSKEFKKHLKRMI